MTDSFIPIPWGTISRNDRPAPVTSAEVQEPNGRADYSAHRIGTALFITATGRTRNYQTNVDLRQLPWRIYPPRFGLFFQDPSAITSPAEREFSITEQFGYPLEQPNVIIHDADGEHVVEITNIASASLVADKAKAARIGYGKTIQEAIDQAILQFPPQGSGIPDGLTYYSVVNFGKVKGGIAGLNLYYAAVDASSTVL